MLSKTPLRAHFFVDGPNIDATFGNGVLGRKPLSHERSRWDRVNHIARTRFGADGSWFVLNGDTFTFERTAFYRCLRQFKFEVPTPKRAEWCRADDQDPVDEYIKERLRIAAILIENRELSGVLIATHDGGYAPALRKIIEVGGSVAVVGFREWFAPELVELRASGANLLDLEDDFGAFDNPLDRPDIAA